MEIETIVVFLPVPWHFTSPFDCLCKVLLPFSSQIWSGPLLISPLVRTSVACSQFCAMAFVAFCCISLPSLSTHLCLVSVLIRGFYNVSQFQNYVTVSLSNLFVLSSGQRDLSVSESLRGNWSISFLILYPIIVKDKYVQSTLTVIFCPFSFHLLPLSGNVNNIAAAAVCLRIVLVQKYFWNCSFRIPYCYRRAPYYINHSCNERTRVHSVKCFKILLWAFKRYLWVFQMWFRAFAE